MNKKSTKKNSSRKKIPPINKNEVAKKQHKSKSRIFKGHKGVKYSLNYNFESYDELKKLILKSSPAEKADLLIQILGLGRVSLAITSGVLLDGTEDKELEAEVADLFIVGDDIDKRKLSRFLKSLEARVGTEIKFTLMDKEEFRYRYGMFDRFVRLLFEGPHEKIINKLGV